MIVNMTKRHETQNQYQLTYGEHVIPYTLIYSKRHKTLAVQVHPDARVVVRAPHGIPLADVELLLRRRAAWIIKHQQRFQSAPARPKTRRYVSGDTFLYLGREYALNVVSAEREHATMRGDQLIVNVRDPNDTARIEQLIARWYRQRAKAIFEERLAACLPLVAFLGVEHSRLTIREMKTRWGSCSAKRRVTLNTQLVRASIDLIDYVIVHELCHLKELNHSRAFYALMDRAMPDWRERRKRLNKVPVL